MDFSLYSRKFTEKANKSGYDQQIIKVCLQYASELFDNEVPVIYNTSHLSALVGYEKNYLKRVARREKGFYRTFKIQKKTGGTRTLVEPLPSLKEIQLWVKDNILEKIAVSKYAKAYIKGRRLKDHLKIHTNKAVLVTLDITDFFGSVKIEMVDKIFYDLGYSKLLSNLLAKICCYENALPQGAPTSPILSNIIFGELDVKIYDFCSSRKIHYTRYADDMAFSGSFNSDELIAEVRKIISERGFSINSSKTRVMKRGNSQRICGVVVNEKLQVPKQKRLDIRKQVHYIKKFGLSSHLTHTDETRANYLLHLLGEIQYVLNINPGDKEFIQYKKTLLSL